MNKEITRYTGSFLTVTEEVIGDQLFERAYLRGAEIIFPINDDGKIILILEERPHETPKLRLKPVTGFFEDGLTWQENVQKELQEEIGYKAGELELIKEVSITGSFNMNKRIVLARNLTPSKLPNPDGDVIREIKAYGIEEIISMIMKNEMSFTFDSLCFFYIREHLNNHQS